MMNEKWEMYEWERGLREQTWKKRNWEREKERECEVVGRMRMEWRGSVYKGRWLQTYSTQMLLTFRVFLFFNRKMCFFLCLDLLPFYEVDL